MLTSGEVEKFNVALEKVCLLFIIKGFREYQKQAVKSILDGIDTFIVSRLGKSLIFQTLLFVAFQILVKTFYLVAIVLCWSYLRSLELMKNQVNILNLKGVKAV